MNKNSKLIAGIDDATKCPCIGSTFLAGVVADEKYRRRHYLFAHQKNLIKKRRNDAIQSW